MMKIVVVKSATRIKKADSYCPWYYDTLPEPKK
jgi:hypothetical protein